MERYEVNWEDDNSVKKYIEDKWQSRDHYKGGLESQWLRIIAAYEGLRTQDYRYVERRLIKNHNVPSWRVRLTINLMLPYVRAAAARHLRNRPTFDVIPATESTEDIAVSQAQRKFLQGYWYQQSVNYNVIDLLLWVALTGNGFWHTYWDPFGGPTIPIPDEVQQILSQQLQGEEALEELRSIPSGEIGNSVPTPFDILTPWCNRFDNAPWMIHSQMREISFYADMGIDVDTLSRPKYSDRRFEESRKRVNSLFSLGASEDSTIASRETQILELNLWMPPSGQKGLENGRWVTWAGGLIINNQSNPYQHRGFPIDHFTSETTPGKMWGFSSASQVLPLIEEHQKQFSQDIESLRLMSRPKWFVPRQARIKRTALTSEPGEIIDYSGNTPPTPGQGAAPNRYSLDSQIMLKRHADTIMSQQEASRGINPAGGRSAAVVQELQAADEASAAIVGLIFDTGFSSVGRKIVSIGDQYYSEDRILSYVGEQNKYESFLLKKDSLSGNSKGLGVNYFNVRVTQFSQFGLSRTGQIELLKLLLQFQVFDQSPKSRSKVLKFVQIGYFEDEIDEYKVDRTNAHRENILMSQGQPISNNAGPGAFMPGMEDHDDTHLEEHAKFMKSDDYKQLPPIIKSIFQYHVQQHKLLGMVKLVEPQVLALPAQIMAANLNRIDPQLLFLAGQKPDESTSKTSKSD